MSIEEVLEAIQGTQFEKDLTVSLSVNGSDMGRGMFNLIVSIRDVKFFCIGMPINSTWRLKHVKSYFGVKGNKHEIAKTLEAYKEGLMQIAVA